MNNRAKPLYRTAFWISCIGLIAIISDFGYTQTAIYQKMIDGFYFFVLTVGLISTFARYIQQFILIKRKVFIFDLLSVLFTL